MRWPLDHGRFSRVAAQRPPIPIAQQARVIGGRRAVKMRAGAVCLVALAWKAVVAAAVAFSDGMTEVTERMGPQVDHIPPPHQGPNGQEDGGNVLSASVHSAAKLAETRHGLVLPVGFGIFCARLPLQRGHPVEEIRLTDRTEAVIDDGAVAVKEQGARGALDVVPPQNGRSSRVIGVEQHRDEAGGDHIPHLVICPNLALHDAAGGAPCGRYEHHHRLTIRHGLCGSGIERRLPGDVVRRGVKGVM